MRPDPVHCMLAHHQCAVINLLGQHWSGPADSFPMLQVSIRQRMDEWGIGGIHSRLGRRWGKQGKETEWYWQGRTGGAQLHGIHSPASDLPHWHGAALCQLNSQCRRPIVWLLTYPSRWCWEPAAAAWCPWNAVATILALLQPLVLAQYTTLWPTTRARLTDVVQVNGCLGPLRFMILGDISRPSPAPNQNRQAWQTSLCFV